MFSNSTIVLVASSILLTAGCGSDETTANTEGGPHGSEPVAWILSAEPAGAQGVAAAKLSVVEGEAVTLRGKIGGRKDPLSTDSAVFVIMDTAIPSCADNPDDKCTTPWDYCCETPDTITANNASIMLVDGDGKPLPVDIAEFGFSALDEIVIVGTVRPRPSDAVLAINATGIYKVGS
jgi:hypothetical protein